MFYFESDWKSALHLIIILTFQLVKLEANKDNNTPSYISQNYID